MLDTHAGAGGYALGEGLARRTGEAEAGIGRLVASPRAGMPAAVVRYLAAVAAYGKDGRDFDGAVGRVGGDSDDRAVLPQETGGLPAHAEGEAGEMGSFGGEEVEEVPLRHEGDEFGVSGEV